MTKTARKPRTDEHGSPVYGLGDRVRIHARASAFDNFTGTIIDQSKHTGRFLIRLEGWDADRVKVGPKLKHPKAVYFDPWVCGVP